MAWYYYLNYRIYCFYARKRESMPALFSFLATTTLIALNIESIVFSLNFFFSFFDKKISYKGYVLFGIAMIALLNYIVLYKGNYHEEVFDDFDKHGVKYEHWNKSVRLYIIFSIAFLLCALVLADLRNHGLI